jgi:mono/diheme cytochrome c family protein
MSKVKVYLIAVAVLLLMACQRGQYSSKPPVHLVPDMDHQPKYKPQSASSFFEDGAAMRLPVSGTVPADRLHEDSLFYRGVDQSGKPVRISPLKAAPGLIAAGEGRFRIYCSPCHGGRGEGQGTVIKRGFIPPPLLWEQRLIAEGDGYIFDVISRGVRNMPSHAHLVPASDRWAIVASVRTLQQGGQARQAGQSTPSN